MSELQWAKDALDKLNEKMIYGVERAQAHDFVPYTVKNGDWSPTNIDWWTNGFWPAEMWQMALETGNKLYRDEAVRTEKMMDEALRNFTALHHDVGFMWLIHSGVRYALEKNADSLNRVLFAGNLLAGRYNPNGFIRAWNDDGQGNRSGWSIIDTMMNLPLLYSMTEITKDPRFALMAKSHADHAIQNFFKPDGSVYHILIYDPETGKVIETPAGQGCAPGSSWSRGQSWAIYGFMLSYLYTGDPAYLSASRRVADFFLSHVRPDDLVPVDFCQPETPDVIDNCASGIAACGLMELSKSLKESDRAASERYWNAAVRLLRALNDHCADWSQNSPAVLTHCTGAYRDKGSHHMYMNYGDYFFIEGLRKLCGETRLFWKPFDFA